MSPPPGFMFVANLRPVSVESFTIVGYRPAAWLLSTHRLDVGTAALAADVRSHGATLFADNGTKAHIDDVVRRFTVPALELQARVTRLRRSLADDPHVPTASEVPTDLSDEASALAHDVVDAAEALAARDAPEATLTEQLAMDPTHLIAKEDFATACLLALGLEREITRWPASYFDRRNLRSLAWWKEASEDRRCRDVAVYVTLSATDYNTGYRAGRLAARADARHVALGFAGINSDASWVSSFLHGGRRALPAPAPRRSTRTTGICAGVRDGIRDAGGSLEAFHALGLGAASAFPILAAVLSPATRISVDSTSPIHDAVRDLVAYDPDDDGDRVTVVEGVHRVVSGGQWPCSGPFCSDIRARKGHQPDLARSWWLDNDSPAISRAMVVPPHPIASALPIFAAGRQGSTTEMNRARIGHNHWTLDSLTRQIPRRQRRRWALTALERLTTHASASIRHGAAAARHIAEHTA